MDEVLRARQSVRGMNPEKALANPPSQHFRQEGNTMCLPNLAIAKRYEIRVDLILVEPFSFTIQQPTYGRVAHKKLVACQ